MLTEDNFDGFRAMGWLGITSAILTNTVKTLTAKNLDYCVIGDMPGACDAGWNKVGQTSGKPSISVTLELSNICDP